MTRNGRVKQILFPNHTSATYVYEGKDLLHIQLDCQVRGDYWFDKNGVVKIKSLLGDLSDYQYSNGRLSAVKQSQYGEAYYSYDEQNRLREMNFPNGSRIEYWYESNLDRQTGSKLPQGRAITMITHPASDLGTRYGSDQIFLKGN